MPETAIATSAYAIDFGTSNTAIARWNAATQQPETVTLPGLSVRLGQNPPLIPSLVYVEDAAQHRVIVGQKVRDRALELKANPRLFRSFKRGIGANIQGFLPELDGQIITFEQVGEWFLNQLIAQLQAQEVGESRLQSLVLTVPVDSFEAYRSWLSQVCQKLPVEQVRMLDEPTAAALGYGMTDQQILLVVDFGGGTLDLSLVRLDGNQKAGKKPLGFILKWGEKFLADSGKQQAKTARVLAKAGQNLGGSDLDNWIAEDLEKTTGLAITPLTIRLAERLKIQLSAQSTAREVYFDDTTFDSYELELDRPKFESILKANQFFERLDESMVQVLQQARRQGIEVADIDGVLLVGGTVQIPVVQTWIKQYFAESKIHSQQPFEAIAKGALYVSQGIEVQDFLYHSYGIRYWDRRNNRHGWHSLIKAGQVYPTNSPVELVLGASTENQPSIELIIGELGAETGGTEVYFDGDRLIARRLGSSQTQVQPLNDKDGARAIAQLNPAGFPGNDRIKVSFQVDAQCFLRITVEDLLANQILLANQPVVQLS